MKFKILDENGNTVNTILADLEFVQSNFEHFEAIEEPIIIDVPEVPTQITPRQLRLQLLAISLLDEVETLCNADKAMSIWFEYSIDFQRNHDMLQAMATQLGMTDADMDNFFIAASKL